MIAVLLPPLIGAALLIALIVAARWFARADTARLVRMAQARGPVPMIAIGLLLVLRGAGAAGMPLVAAGLGQLAGGRTGGFGSGPRRGPFRTHTGGGGGGTGRRSSVRTGLLDASLDHATGEIDAVIRAGRFAGRQLSAMSKAEALGLWADCAADTDSRLVVEAYLDRRHPEWRLDVEGDRDAGAGGARGPGGPNRGSAMTEERAYDVLGLALGASEAEVRQAHRRLMKEAHPDQGGDTARAAEINEAKEILLRGRRR